MLKFLILILVSAVSGIASVEDLQNSTRQGRDYYYPSDQEKNNYYQDYPPLTHPSSNYIPYKDGPTTAPSCAPSPLIPILNNALQFILLKLGAIGVIKAIFATLFVIFLFKLPIILAKAAFLKAFVLPILLAPLMLLFPNLGQNMMMAAMQPMGEGTTSTEKPSSGRKIDDFDQLIMKNSWHGIKMLLDNEKCAERLVCQLGAWNNDLPSGRAFTRMVKYMESSSPTNAKSRIQSLRDAFTAGNEQGTCNFEVYPCQTPSLVLNQGNQTMRVL